MGNHPIPYVLITPARNEEAFIEKTLQSVIKQTILPAKWVIVNDGSTDATSSIVRPYLGLYLSTTGSDAKIAPDDFAYRRHRSSAPGASKSWRPK